MRNDPATMPLAFCLAIAAHCAVLLGLGHALGGGDRADETLAPAMIVGIEFAKAEPVEQVEIFELVKEDEVEASIPANPVDAVETTEQFKIFEEAEADVLASIPANPVDEVEIVEPTAPVNVVSAENVTLPRARNQIRPTYPERSRKRGEEGTAIYEVEVNERGRVSTMTLIQSSGFPELDNAARRALLAARFDPATRDGKPIAFHLQLPMEFKIVGR